MVQRFSFHKLTKKDHDSGVDLVRRMLRRVALYPHVGPEVALANLTQVFAGKRLKDLQDTRSAVPHTSCDILANVR